MEDFKAGDKIALEFGGEVTVISRLGSGGQGTVYKVDLNGKEHALKWYHPNRIKNPERFRINLKTNINKGAPDKNKGTSGKKFLWPLDLTKIKDNSFGYIMELRPKEFSDFADILNAKAAFSDLYCMVNAALNIVNGFRELHREGLSYQDLNDGNFFINVNTGDVLICDNDNVAPDQESFGIGGKPGYMAPEVVRGVAKPYALTDYHSLAVILFKLFIRHDPLMGANYVNSVFITEEKELELYGTKPVFVFDPNDQTNRPATGVHNNPIKFWPKYPKYLQNAFIQSFCEGMKNPNKRLPENEWQKLLIQLRDDIVVCSCGAPTFITNAKFDSNNISSCEVCGRKFSKPMKLKIKSFEVNMFPKNKLYKCHTVDNRQDSDDYMTETGEVIQNKNDPRIWGIRNTSEDTWLMKTPDGMTKQIPPNFIIPIVADIEVTFTNIGGKIQK